MNAAELGALVKETVKATFDEIVACFTGRFLRKESRACFVAVLRALLSPITRKNSWQIAEQIGDETPYGVQEFYNRQRWESDDLRDDLQHCIVEHFGEDDGVFVTDETGFLKKGKQSAGVGRQYTGTAGGIVNCQIGVFLAYTTSKGTTLLDRGLYLPKEWTDDRRRCRNAGIPDTVEFQTKQQIFLTMLQRARNNGVPGQWVAADEVYGNDSKLRKGIEALDLGYVLTVPKTHRFLGTCKVQAQDVTAWWPTYEWKRLSAGEGSKEGPRLYDWAFRTLPSTKPGWERALLIRRSIANPEDLAYFLIFAPEGTPLEKLVEVAGTRWSIETSFKLTKNEVGLDHYEVRTHTGWYRYITICMIAFFCLTLIRNRLRTAEGIDEKKTALLISKWIAYPSRFPKFGVSSTGSYG
jgi:SRSO17 transposase